MAGEEAQFLATAEAQNVKCQGPITPAPLDPIIRLAYSYSTNTDETAAAD